MLSNDVFQCFISVFQTLRKNPPIEKNVKKNPPIQFNNVNVNLPNAPCKNV